MSRSTRNTHRARGRDTRLACVPWSAPHGVHCSAGSEPAGQRATVQGWLLLQAPAVSRVLRERVGDRAACFRHSSPMFCFARCTWWPPAVATAVLHKKKKIEGVYASDHASLAWSYLGIERVQREYVSVSNDCCLKQVRLVWRTGDLLLYNALSLPRLRCLWAGAA